MMIIAGTIIVLLLAFWVSAAVRFLGAIFSSADRTRIAAHPVLHGLWLLAAVASAAGVLLFPAISCPPGKSDRPRAMTTIVCLETACKAYQTEYCSFPTGDNAAITRVLREANPRNIVFIEFRSRDTNSVGEVIDPWGTPYRFTLENGKKPVIKSAGPDRVFESKDDLSSSSP